MWRSMKNFEVRDLGSNTVLIIFDNDADPQKIIVQGLWTFDKYLIVLYKLVGEESVDDATFDYASFWVQIHNLPLRQMNKVIAEAIGRTLGTIEQVDVSTTGECPGRYLRVRVQINITQPLYREKHCTLWTDSGGTLNTEHQQYGAWLRAPLNNLQQPQLASKTTTPKPSQPRAPPRPPRPMPSTHTTGASTTAATTDPVRQSNHPDSSPPTISKIAMQKAPTNMEILLDSNLFHAHIAEIDNAINNFPLTPQSTVTQKEGLKSVDPPERNPSNLRQAVSPNPGLHDTHLVDAPIKHVLDIKSMTGLKRLMDPI
uniref:DUF4283 domain-containing protein n=1 Tax=Quercus lobata TaxID=97700 RepID=A0A7N2LCU4_QUELO